MSSLRRNEKVIAIAAADIHLSHKAPIWRSAEPDWYEAMKRPLLELQELKDKYNCPVFYAGDIFHDWFGAVGKNASRLINFAIRYLPEGHAIPGQHDLPLHNYEDIQESAYWTLVEAERIRDISTDLYNISESKITIYGFPYGKKIKRISNKSKFIQIALAHEYKWVKGCSYPGANKKDQILSIRNKGYDVIIYGDNHKGFTIHGGKKGTVFNCGSLMRRHSDQIDYKPAVGLITSKGRVIRHYLDTSQDKYIEASDFVEETKELDMSAVIEELTKLGDADFDFKESVKKYLKIKKVDQSIKNILLNAMEKEK